MDQECTKKRIKDSDDKVNTDCSESEISDPGSRSNSTSPSIPGPRPRKIARKCRNSSSPKGSLDSIEISRDRISHYTSIRNDINLADSSAPNSSSIFPSLHTPCPPLFMAPNLFKPILTTTPGSGCPLNLSMSSSLNTTGFRHLSDYGSSSEPDSAPMTTRSTSETPSPDDAKSLQNINDLRSDSRSEMVNSNVRSSSLKRPSPGLMCVVCGDTSSGKHYGILACNGCSGFFKRSVRRKLIYRCQAGTGSCIIDKQHRNQCQACRLKKCLQMGMNKDAVQNERQPRNTATIRPETLLNDRESERLLREGVAATVNALFIANTGIRGLNSNQSHAIQFPISNQFQVSTESREQNRNGDENKSENGKGTELDVNRNINHFEYTNNLTYQSNNGNSLSSSFPYPSTGDSSFSAIIPCHQESIYETSARLLFMAVKWAKNLPSFGSLTFRDQVILLEESWSELFLLCAIQWCLPMENCQLFSTSSANENNLGLTGEKLSDLRVLNDILNRFKSIAVDPGEFACLKALSLFKPEARGLKDVPRIESMQDQAQIMLLQHEKARNPTSPTRFGRLLLLLVSLRFVSAEKIGTIYFQRTIGNTPMEKLLCDMFKC